MKSTDRRYALAVALAAGLVFPVPAADPPPPAGPWGVSSSASAFGTHAEWFPKVAAAGVTSVRLFPGWRGCEPKPGEWDWDRADGLLKSAADNNLEITAVLMGSPHGEKVPHTFPMADLPGWSAFAGKAAGRYKGKVRYWEVWNEGNGGFNGGKHTTADYATLAATTYDAIKKADPDAKVGLSVASFDAPYLRQTMLAMAKQGTPDRFDYLCVHPYELAGGLNRPDGEVPFLWMSKFLRDVLKDAAPKKADAELWITEVGRPVGAGRHPVTGDDAAGVFAKVYVMAIAQGIARTQWFEGQDAPREEAGFGLLDRKGAPRPAYDTLKRLTTELGRNPKYLGWLALGKGGRGYGFAFARKAGPVVVAWLPVGHTDAALAFGSDTSVTDLVTGKTRPVAAGKPVGLANTPVLVTGLPDEIAAQARENAGKPFPWGGDHSAATAVRCDLGRADGDAGVACDARTTHPTVAYPDGSSGVLVPGDLRHPLAFTVHPSFASVLTSEYHVRVTVRRVGAGNVGMNLRAEVADSRGRSAYANVGGWFAATKADGWQTHTWHVTGASFSKIWGADLYVVPEQSVPFVVGKIEVSTKPFAPGPNPKE